MIDKHFNTAFDIYRVSSSVDENNFDIQSDILYSTGKGFFEPLSGNERVINQKYESFTTHRLFTSIINITESDTLYIDSCAYNIDLIQNYQNDHLEIILIRKK
jgi:hypothetical protein